MSEPGIDPQAAFRVVVDRHGGHAPAGGRGFGSDALKVEGRIFASLSKGRLLLKLPAARVDDLIQSGIGERFSTGPGHPKHEWVTISPSHASQWVELSEEARRFVQGQGDAKGKSARE
jgi:hypothetical protein